MKKLLKSKWLTQSLMALGALVVLIFLRNWITNSMLGEGINMIQGFLSDGLITSLLIIGLVAGLWFSLQSKPPAAPTTTTAATVTPPSPSNDELIRFVRKHWLGAVVAALFLGHMAIMFALALVFPIIPVWVIVKRPKDIHVTLMIAAMAAMGLVIAVGTIWVPAITEGLAWISAAILIAFTNPYGTSYILTKLAEDDVFFTKGAFVNNLMAFMSQNVIVRWLLNEPGEHLNVPGRNADKFPEYELWEKLPNKWGKAKDRNRNGSFKPGTATATYNPKDDDPFDFGFGYAINSLIARWERKHNVYFISFRKWAYTPFTPDQTEHEWILATEEDRQRTGVDVGKIIGVKTTVIKGRKNIPVKKKHLLKTYGDTGATVSEEIIDGVVVKTPEKVEVGVYTWHYVMIFNPDRAFRGIFFDELLNPSLSEGIHDLISKKSVNTLVELKGSGKGDYEDCVYKVNGVAGSDSPSGTTWEVYDDPYGLIQTGGVGITETYYQDYEPVGPEAKAILNSSAKLFVKAQEKKGKEIDARGDAAALGIVGNMLNINPGARMKMRLDTLKSFTRLANIGNVDVLLDIKADEFPPAPVPTTP